MYTLLFVFTYLPQVAFLAIFYQLYALAFVNAVFLVLAEGAAITALLFEAFLADETQVDVFDSVRTTSIPHLPPPPSPVHWQLMREKVLINEGLLDLIAPVREIRHDGTNPVEMLGKPLTKAQYAPFSFRQICEFVLFLPINLIPFVGTPLFLVLTGYRGGPFHHWRYFQLLGFTRKQRKRFVKSRRWSYTW